MRLIKDKTNINFLGASRRRIALTISVVAVIAALVSISVRGLDFGIDFTGGILLEVGYPAPADVEQIRADLEADGFEDAQVTLFGEATDVLVRLPPQQEGNQQEIRRGVGRIDFRVPSGKHFVHAGVIIGRSDGANGIAAVSGLVRMAVDENHHGGHRIRAGKVGVVKAFDSFRDTVHTQPFLQRFQNAGGLMRLQKRKDS